MKYKHFIFDIDGTLVDNEKVVLMTWQETIAQLMGKHYEVSKLGFVLGIPGETSMQRLGIADTQEAFKLWGRNFAVHKEEIALFPGIESTVEALHRKGIKLGLATSRTHDELGNDNALCKVLDYFDAIICVTDTLRPKPYPDPLIACINKNNTSAEETIYIGDSAYDCQCAKSAGVDFGLALWGDNSTRKGLEADYFFNKPEEILNIALSL